MTVRRLVALLGIVLLCSVIALVAAGTYLRSQAPHVPTAPFAVIQPLAEATEHRVTVRLALEQDNVGVSILAATFAPERGDDHLYAVTLPPQGIDGVGRPTRLALGESPGVRASGPAIADQPIVLREYEGFSAAFPTYPDGPVTLRLPLRLLGDPPHRATVLVSYMACNRDGTCHPPVIDKAIAVEIHPRP